MHSRLTAHSLIERNSLMLTRNARRIFPFVLFLGGPILGWFINGDRGLMFGFAVSVLAVIWYILEHRRIV